MTTVPALKPTATCGMAIMAKARRWVAPNATGTAVGMMKPTRGGWENGWFEWRM
jgi:hypothetical protein